MWYLIKYKNGNSDIQKNVSDGSTQTKIENLVAFTLYKFRITCQSSGGKGPESPAFEVKTSPTSKCALLVSLYLTPSLSNDLSIKCPLNLAPSLFNALSL